MADFPSYGDVLRRDPADPTRDQIKATDTWTPVRLPGPGGMWRHWADGRQVDLPSSEPPT